MPLRKLIIIFAILTLVMVIGWIANDHQIILRWLSGTARHIGKPIEARVYTNGKLNPDILVYHVDKYWGGKDADYFLVHLTYADTKTGKEFISINRKDNYVGKPSSTDKREYDEVLGRLFQSKVGGLFTPFTDDIKGYDFDPQLSFSGNTIKLKMPQMPPKFKYDSIRIEL